MHSSMKFLLESFNIPRARYLPGSFMCRFRVWAFINRLVVCWPHPLGTRIVIVLAKQCLVVLTWRRDLMSSMVRGGRCEELVVGLVGVVVGGVKNSFNLADKIGAKGVV